jgi:hypothetical protein
MKRKIPMAAAILLALGAHAAADDKITLTLKLEKGATYDVELSSKVSQSTTLLKSEISQNTATDLTARLAVEEISETGVMTIRVTYKSLKMELDNPSAKMSGDSATTKGVSPADKMCAALVGKSFTVDLDALGNVTKIGDVKELIDGVATTLAADWGQSKVLTVSQLTPLFNETALAQQFAAGLKIFPDRPVAVGEKWTIKSPAAAAGAFPVNSESTFTLREKNTNAVIASETRFASPKDHKSTVNGENTLVNVTGAGGGTIEVDLKTGMTWKTTSNSQLAGTLVISSPDGKTSETAHVVVKSSSTTNIKPAK